MRSCCKQVKDFLEFGKKLHGAIGEFYQKANEAATSERLKMLLDYLGRHEGNLEQSLARFEKESRSGVLNAWLEFPTDLNVEAVINSVNVEDIQSVDDLIKTALDLDESLVKIYREAASKVEEPKLKELFLNLLELEEKEKTLVSRAGLSLLDI